MADEITLSVNGQIHRGWETVSVVRSIDAMSGAFDLGVTQDWGATPREIGKGDRCVVAVNGSPVVTGYVERKRLSARPGGFELSVHGRDATADLVDSSADLPPWEFVDQQVITLARKIAAPHGVPVNVQPGLVLSTVPKFSIDPGQTCGHAIETLCRKAGVLATSDGNGGLLLTRASSERTRTRLVLGVNLLTADLEVSDEMRFRTYKVLGSHRKSAGHGSHSIKGVATDATARASRLAVIRPEGNVTGEQAKRRAEWEASVRASKSDTVTVTVSGWSHRAHGAIGPREPWHPNMRVDVDLSAWGFVAEMLVTSVRFDLSIALGVRTQLTLARPDAYTPDPTLNGPRTGGGNNYWPEIVKGV